MKRAFTLIELLVVIGIMGLLGTVSVGGYRAMQRGMAERGVMKVVDSLISAAYQRAQVDRQPTAVYFWNETLRKADDYNTEIVVGKAVAIRRYGRLTRVDNGKLFDEFADLNLSYSTDENADSASDATVAEGTGDDQENTMYLYPIDRLQDISKNSELVRTLVYQKVAHDDTQLLYLSGDDAGTISDNQKNGELRSYAFKVASGDGGKVSWEPGMAYGFEFAQIELPHGYIFGTSYSRDVSNPIEVQGTLVFNVGLNTGNGVSDGAIGRTSITVSSLRPGSSGEISAQSIGTTADPTKEMK